LLRQTQNTLCSSCPGSRNSSLCCRQTPPPAVRAPETAAHTSPADSSDAYGTPSSQAPTAPSASNPGSAKRAAPDALPAHRKTKNRRVTRACDQCQRKPGGCSGFKPCFTCDNPSFHPGSQPELTLCPGTKRGLTCTYDRPYRRGLAKTPPPPPEGDDGTARNWAQPLNEKGQQHRDKGWVDRACDRCRTLILPCEGKLPCSFCFPDRVECTFNGWFPLALRWPLAS
jgi:hypothetical protein